MTKNRSIFFIFTAVLFAGSIMTFEKYLLQKFSSSIFAFLVFFGGCVPVFFILKFFKKPIWKTFSKNKKLFWTIGFLNFFRVILWFFAMKNFFLGEFGFLAKSEILFTILLGVIFLSEKFYKYEILFLLLSLFGIFLVSFRNGVFLFWPTMAIFCSQFLMAIQNILTKKNIHLDPFVFNFWRATLTQFFLTFYLILFEGFKLFHEIFDNLFCASLIILDGFIGIFIMRYFLFTTMRYFPASKTSIFFSFSGFLTLLFGHIFLGEELFWWQLCGGFILIFSIIFLLKLHKKV